MQSKLLPDYSYQFEEQSRGVSSHVLDRRPHTTKSKSTRLRFKTPAASAFAEKQWESQMLQATFASEDFQSFGVISTDLGFYRFLSSSSGRSLRLWIPDTVIFNAEGGPLWVYTNSEGEVSKRDYFMDMKIFQELGNVQDGSELSAVVKRPTFSNSLEKYKGFLTIPLNSDDLRQLLSESVKAGPFVLQKYVKSKGPLAFVCRTVYLRNSKPYVWVITNKHSYNSKAPPERKFVTDISSLRSASVCKFYSGNYLKETLPYMHNLVKHFEEETKVQIQLLACDFVKDEDGNWWFLGCKAIKYTGDAIIDNFLSKEYSPCTHEGINDYERLKRCRICQLPYPPEQLIHNLTIKMITETDQLLRDRGISIKWLDRAEYRHSDNATIYQSYPVCKDCYALYDSNQELKELANLYRKAFHIPLPPVDLKTEEERTANMTMCRLMVSFVDLKEAGALKQGTYSLEFAIFNRKTKTYIKKEQGQVTVPIRKNFLFHCFVFKQSEWTHYLAENPKFVITLSQGASIASFTVDLHSFANPIVLTKTYYEAVIGKEDPLGYIQLNVGVEQLKVNNVPYGNWDRCKELYIPPKYYFFPAELYSEWIDLIPDGKPPLAKPPLTPVEVHSNSHNILKRRHTKPKRRYRVSSARKKRQEPLEFSLDNHSIDPSTNYSGTLNISKLAPMQTGTSDIYGEWELSISILSLRGITDSTSGTWKIAFNVLGSKFKTKETYKHKGIVRFECTQQLVLRCRRSALRGVLCLQKVHCSIYKFEDKGTANVDLSSLAFEKQASFIVPVHFKNQANADLEVMISLDKLREATVVFPIRNIAPGVEVLTKHLKK